jgi:hypothetical protein
MSDSKDTYELLDDVDPQEIYYDHLAGYVRENGHPVNLAK